MIERVARALWVDYWDGDACAWEDAEESARETSRSLARAALKAMQDGWQPIETAPKDGTRIDVWFQLTIDHGARWANVLWSPEHEIWSGGPPSQYKDGWVATHWMPFPASPEIAP